MNRLLIASLFLVAILIPISSYADEEISICNSKGNSE